MAAIASAVAVARCAEVRMDHNVVKPIDAADTFPRVKAVAPPGAR